MISIVDIHCHTFNASDLPTAEYIVDGFVFHGHAPLVSGLTKLLVMVLTKPFIRRRMLGNESERLDEMIQLVLSRTPPHREGREDSSLRFTLDDERSILDDERDLEETLEHTLHDNMAAFGIGDEAFIKEIQAGLKEGSPEQSNRSSGSLLLFLRHILQYRYKNTRDLINSFPAVELFTPSVIDFGTFGPLNLSFVSTPLQTQMEIHEKISILSALGGIPGVDRPANIHPLFTFNPETKNSLELLQKAISTHGFLGAKIYPSMGWQPDLCDERVEINRRVRDFYEYCAEKEVPIMTHSSPSAYADKKYNEANHPQRWRDCVLSIDEFKGLHINFGHFGEGKAHSSKRFERSKVIASMIRPSAPFTGTHSIFLPARLSI